MITEPVLPGQDEESLALERAILGRLLIHPDRFYEVNEHLTPRSFYGSAHRSIFETMQTLHQAGKDMTPFHVFDELQRQGNEHEGCNLPYILNLTNYDPWYNALGADAELLARRAFGRDLIFKAPAISQIGYDGGTIAEMLARAQAELDSLRVPDRGRDLPMSEVMAQVMIELDQAYAQRGAVVGIQTGLTDLDRTLGELQPGNLILVAARPSMGKSALSFQIGYKAALDGHEVATYSLEMSAREIGLRYLAHAAAIPMRRLKKGWLREEEHDAVAREFATISDLPLTINETSGQPISAIRDALTRRAHERGKPAELVIVDYLQLMEPEATHGRRREQSRVQEIDQISRGLKAIAKDFNVPVLACAQLNRAVESRQSKKPQLSDLRESGGLEQDADIVLLLHRDDYYNPPDPKTKEPTSERPGIVDVDIAKNRNDETGLLTLRWVGALTRFKDVTESEHAPA